MKKVILMLGLVALICGFGLQARAEDFDLEACIESCTGNYYSVISCINGCRFTAFGENLSENAISSQEATDGLYAVSEEADTSIDFTEVIQISKAIKYAGITKNSGLIIDKDRLEVIIDVLEARAECIDLWTEVFFSGDIDFINNNESALCDCISYCKDVKLPIPDGNHFIPMFCDNFADECDDTQSGWETKPNILDAACLDLYSDYFDPDSGINFGDNKDALCACLDLCAEAATNNIELAKCLILEGSCSGGSVETKYPKKPPLKKY